MKYGVREICDVVLKAKSTQVIGSKKFYKGEPVIYFDTLKTSSLEGASSTVYAQGGKGNPRLIAWDGERTLTFTMEDALISTESFMILSGAGLVEASASAPLYQHTTETVAASGVSLASNTLTISMTEVPAVSTTASVYVMLMKNGEIVSEPYIGTANGTDKTVTITASDSYIPDLTAATIGTNGNFTFDSVLVDYYIKRTSGAQQIEIEANKFSGNYYLEGSTLFRNTDGVDMPAEFIIPNCKVQSNFNFTMAASGDPSTFTFTMDAFPDYTKYDKTKKVLAAIQVITDADGEDEERIATAHSDGGIFSYAATDTVGDVLDAAENYTDSVTLADGTTETQTVSSVTVNGTAVTAGTKIILEAGDVVVITGAE